jgi:predicted RNA binding protein YcfA (HicA-like mRNA interferase family)
LAKTLTAKEAEKLLLGRGFVLLRTKGSHKIYCLDKQLIVIPFHGKKNLHPKIVKQVIEAIA